ncbi:DUF2184 domain-containing protein [Roseixanthobacter pseudopolyaromaticivorans]|uniref:DUF2184 domain-containing protein n=1 Tax=Xanthobacteraceae TaxID=335928 RepID=UPI00372AEA0A
MFHDKNLLAGVSRPAIIRARTRDAMMTYDRRTIDSAGAFLIQELERLDQTLHMPLVSVTWSRDIDLREDVSIADETSSFTNSSFAAAGGITAGGKSWIGKDANAISGVSLDIGKTAQPLYLWGQEISWTIPELESAAKLGRPVDSQKFEVMRLKHNMDTDEQVYIGDSVLGVYGLVNHNKVTNVTNVANGASLSPLWESKTADEILADVNELLSSVWAASGWAVIPTELRLPPKKYSYLVSQKVSNAGNMSILEYLRANNLAKSNGQDLNIQPLKWLNGAGSGGTQGDDTTTNRMKAYTKDPQRVRFPMTPLQRTPLEYRSLYQLTTYFGRLGVVEVVYPETIGYRDGL